MCVITGRLPYSGPLFLVEWKVQAKIKSDASHSALSTSVKSCNVVLNNKERTNNSSSVTTTPTSSRGTYLSATTTATKNLLSVPKSPSVSTASNGGGFCYGIVSPTTIDSRTCEERNLTFAFFRFPKKSRENCFPVSR
jgi:hypothetical protein